MPVIKKTGCVAAAVVLAALLAAPASMASTPLYPDLRVLPPRDLRLERVDVSGGDSGATGMHNVLRFSNTVWNGGDGDLTVLGSPAEGQSGPARQRIYDDTGGYTERPAGNFTWHVAHRHYHYQGWGLYQLWKAADYDAWVRDGEPPRVVEQTGTKTTSCILDDEFVGGVPATRWPDQYRFEGCLRDGNGQLLEGLSVGWGDTYNYWRHDQWIDLDQTTLADGDYVIRTVVDPGNQIYESPGGADTARESTKQNSAIQRFRMQGGHPVDDDPPTGTVSLDDVAATTADTSVNLKVIGHDDVSGISQFRVSNDGVTYTAPIDYTGLDSTPHQMAWNLADARYGGDASAGLKTVRVQFRDATGKWGADQIDTIRLQPSDPGTVYSRAVRADNPIGHWRLDESAATFGALDAVGRHDGTFGGTPALGTPGLLGAEPDHTAVGFDGDDFVYVPDDGAFGMTGAMTLEAWIDPTSLPAPGTRAGIVTKPGAYSLGFAGDQLQFTVFPDGNVPAEPLTAPAGAVPVARISHVVATFDGSMQRLYVDGRLVASRPLAKPARIGGSRLYIGSGDGSTDFFHGTIDEPAVYAAAVPLSGIRAHYDAGKPPAEAPGDPSTLTAADVSASRIDLAWSDNSNDESSFEIQRSTSADFTGAASISVPEDREAYTDESLDPNRTYWYRVRARNPVGASGWSNAASDTTRDAAPVATTSAAGGLGPTVATLNGKVNPRGAATTYRFEYGVPPGFGTSKPVPNASAGAGRSDVAVSVDLTGLEPQTTYQYRIVATNAGGTTTTTPAGTFTTPALPAPATFTAAAASPTQIDLAWTDSSTDETGYEIQRSTSADFTNPTTITRPAGATAYADSSDLLPNQSYFYRVRTRRNAAASAWATGSATTRHAAPVATTSAAGGIGSTAATLNGSVDPRGSATTYRFEYGPTTAYGQTTPPTSAGSGRGVVAASAALTGLDAATTYHYRIVATSAGGTTSGDDASFTTQAAAGGGVEQTQPQTPSASQTQPQPTPLPDPGTPNSDTRRPRASLSVPVQSLPQVLRRGLSLKLKSDEPGTASLRVLATPSSLLRESARVRLVIGSRTQRLRTSGAVVAVVRLNTNARRVLARRRSVKLWIEVAVSDGAGNSSATSRIAVTLRAEPASRRR